jgi:hypothetical protein
VISASARFERRAGSAELQLVPQRGEEPGFRGRLGAIGVADAYRELIGQLAVLGLPQVCDRLRRRDVLEQDRLHDRTDVEARVLRAERRRDALDLVALGIRLGAIGERGQQSHREQGALFA